MMARYLTSSLRLVCGKMSHGTIALALSQASSGMPVTGMSAT